MPMKLILGSTSPFRKELLERLKIKFSCASPDVDETPIESESIESMVMRLSELKAEAIAEKIKNDGEDALIIGSDQSAVLNGKPLTKPGNFENAVKQLTAASGQRITFQTGLCLLNTATGQKQTICEPYTVVFKKLSPETIERYLKIEQPYNCAGSFKSEGLGIALFEKFEGEDPNSLIGLPLIKLVGMLSNEGVEIPPAS
ncbi:MAG: Maf family nucleotide pyrophosphatase [Gammaproteobacteria bacterium]|nr:Maf family nucleotide pyrophosphatase [Gammaproteobacteria bacterium]